MIKAANGDVLMDGSRLTVFSDLASIAAALKKEGIDEKVIIGSVMIGFDHAEDVDKEW